MLSFFTYALLAQLASAQIVDDVLGIVNPLIGTRGGGNIFAGATLPYGMAKAVADTNSTSRQAGFTTDGAFVTGFSGMHDTAIGASPSLGNFALFPHASCDNDEPNGCDFPKKARAIEFYNESLVAEPGYFALTLFNGVNVEMTVTQHTSLYQFNFPGDTADFSSALILLDLTDLSDSRQDNGSISIDPSTGRMTGSAIFKPSFGLGEYELFYCADFTNSNGIRDTGIFVDSRASVDVQDLQISRGINGYPLPGGGFIRFPTGTTQATARVATSFRSWEQACELAETEIPDWDFDGVREAAADAWRQKLEIISVDYTGLDERNATSFYSGIYRSLINPQNYTGVVPAVGDGVVYWDSFYCIFDTFRTQMPLLTIVDPSAVEEMMGGLLTIYELEGWLPDCHMSTQSGYTEGGSNADILLADAYLKLKDYDIDWALAYEAVVKDAEEEPYDWHSRGRGSLDSWKSVGYVPVSDFDYKGFGTLTRSISRTLEYSYNDFCIAAMSDLGLGSETDTQKYIDSSSNWQNLFNDDQQSFFPNGTDTGFVGFFQPRYGNGTWGSQDPLNCSPLDERDNRVCSLQNNAAETLAASIWEYLWFVPHDMATLITTLGGRDAFVSRLDFLHDNGIAGIGNQATFNTAFQYHYAGRPGRSTFRRDQYFAANFSAEMDGQVTNEDSGASGALVAFSLLGLWPNPGQDVYFIVAPIFPDVNITNPDTGNVARIRTVGPDSSSNTTRQVFVDTLYIQSVERDGEDYSKNWIGHDFFTDGGELVVYLGEEESGWGTGSDDVPPSLGEYDY